MDLFNQKYRGQDMSQEARKERIEAFRLQGCSVIELAQYFFPWPVSRVAIYELYSKLWGKGFRKVKMERFCVVCSAPLKTNSSSTRMHLECRKFYLTGKRKEVMQKKRESAFTKMYKKILRS